MNGDLGERGEQSDALAIGGGAHRNSRQIDRKRRRVGRDRRQRAVVGAANAPNGGRVAAAFYDVGQIVELVEAANLHSETPMAASTANKRCAARPPARPLARPPARSLARSLAHWPLSPAVKSLRPTGSTCK